MRSDTTRQLTRGRVPRSRRWRLAYGAGSVATLAAATALTVAGPVRADPAPPAPAAVGSPAGTGAATP